MQDPWHGLSPRLTVAELVAEPLDLLGADGERALSGGRRRRGACERWAGGLGRCLGARSHEFCGGQLQRIALARALVVAAKLLVADERTSMLDASEQARLMMLLRERQAELGLCLVWSFTTWR